MHSEKKEKMIQFLASKIVMLLICFHLVNSHIYETFPFSDIHQDILAHRYQFYFIEIQNPYF